MQTNEPYYKELLDKLASLNIKYNPVENHNTKLTDSEIISELSGGDMTGGSCASVALAYIGQKQGWNILDFRGGKSEDFFSDTLNLWKLSQAKGLKTIKATGKSSIAVGKGLLEQCELGKEYYLSLGEHASIVRKTTSGIEYLELQDKTINRNGWTSFGSSIRNKLNYRFGCNYKNDRGASQLYDFMIEIDGSDFGTDEFKTLLGYINTNKRKQKKGKHGTVK